jgi:hypothetical protein
MKFIIYIDDFQVKGFTAKLIPLWVDLVIVNRLGVFKLTVFFSVKGG